MLTEEIILSKKISQTKECTNTIMAIHDAMDILNGKWKVSIIACLCYQKMRYTDILKEVKGISGKMLSRDLKELEANLLITRSVQNTQPITVEYEITEYGSTLKNVISVLAAWGHEHRKMIKAK
jgi:DNA-binding HxlR family transcriptional regulator